MITRLSDQPKAEMKPWLKGANRNMPAEPAAVPMPNAMERCSGVTLPGKAEDDAERSGADRRTDQHAAADMQPDRCTRMGHHQ